MTTTTSSILIPPDWSRRERPDLGVSQLEPHEVPASGYPPQVALFGEPTEASLEDWLQANLQTVLASLTGAAVDEVEIQDLGGRDAGYLRALHLGQDRHLLTEMWVWTAPGVGWVLSATVDLRDYVDYEEVFEEMAWSFDPDPP